MDESLPSTEDAAFEAGGQFLSPDDARPLLTALEGEDRTRLKQKSPDLGQAADANPDEFEGGTFIAPGGIDEAPPSPPPPPPRQSPEAPQAAEVLARIAKEVHSIRNELGALKSSPPAPVSPPAEPAIAAAPPGTKQEAPFPPEIHEDVRRLLAYLDGLLESLPEAKIDEFVRSDYFELYRKVFEFFGLT